MLVTSLLNERVHVNYFYIRICLDVDFICENIIANDFSLQKIIFYDFPVKGIKQVSVG